ncbi:AAA domain-containing protein, partial [Candidatus Igneacidithiobacillus taiwanensis]|uniref:AAA domain-containing protein n=1 Tax=Candidatus Igneacidithiobacillus taiwanensis TaxID=1945924 RepID=UPI0028A0E2BD
LTFALARRAIVVGDIYQLEPIWNLTESDELFLLDRVGIDQLDPAYSAARGSVMQVAQRATAFGLPDPERERPAGIPLMAHYRCRETIIGYCRELIYHDDLRPMRKDEKSLCPYPPMTWVAVEDSTAQRMNSSWINEREAEEIVGWLVDEKDRLINQYKNPNIAQIVAIIAPFRAQADLIRARVAKHPELGQEVARNMTINTVHALQGAEMPVVAFSVTQTQPPFFANGSPEIKPNMLNVAVSRAQDAFVLFASPDVLQQESTNKAAKEPLSLLVDYLHRKGQRLYPRELVIIESPQKAEHITRALGRTARILATEGHFLEIAAWPKGKEPQWAESNAAFTGRLAVALRDAGQLDWLVLATDDDRDGEEIAWHVLRYVERLSPRLLLRTIRMRFHDLAPDSLRRARASAQPGVDLRRVQASILKRLADYRFMERTQQAVGQRVGRNQLATLSYLETASIPDPQRYRVVLHGSLADHPVTAYVVSSPSATAPAPWVNQETAFHQVAKLAVHHSLPVQAVLSVERDFPPFPPQTTARFLISGWRRYGWRPQESAQHLQNLYWGRYNTTIKAGGGPA